MTAIPTTPTSHSFKRTAAFVAAGLLAASASVLQAQQTITYIDAVAGASGNTFKTGSTLDDTSWFGSGTGASDTHWMRRTVFGNAGTVFQATTNSDPNSIPELTTRITGLADEQYDIYVFFWSTTSPWRLDSGLTSGALDGYTKDTAGVVAASNLSFSNTVMTVEDNRTLYAVNLGQVTIVGGEGAGTVDVFVDHLGPTGSNDRVWYDGVGYAVVPEPAAVALLGGLLAMGAVLSRRRRG